MYLKVALVSGLLSACAYATNVPSDLTVDALTAHTMDKAVQRALTGQSEKKDKPLAQAHPFATQDLIKALTAAAQVQSQCAVPLLEVKGGDGKKIDPLAKATGNLKIDQIAKPAPIGPCRFNISSVK